jgi:Tfp pilus assembly protein PilO
MKLPEIEWERYKGLITQLGLVVLFAVAVYVILINPMLGDLKSRKAEYEGLDNEISEMYRIIKSVGQIRTNKVLLTEGEASQAMDDLTKHGRKVGVDFLSINTGNVQHKAGTKYSILPIKLKVEGTYEQVGMFLGSLDDLDRGLVKVQSFSITRDDTKPTKVVALLELDIYLSSRKFRK